MHCHLVTVEVRVERRTDQGMQMDGLSLNQDRLESLNTQTVQRWRTVEHNRTIRDHLFQHLPNFRALALDQALRGLDVRGIVVFHQALDDERTVELQGHRLG